jgi:SP family myo-inositol transporter-like MFS transporter 13
MALVDDKKDEVWKTEEHIEDVGSEDNNGIDIAALTSIEDAATSKAAWLITLTVSLGGFLFGMAECSVQSTESDI